MNGAGAFGASINLTTDRISDVSLMCSWPMVLGVLTHASILSCFPLDLISNQFELSGRLSKIDSDGYIDRASADLKSYFLQGIFRASKHPNQSTWLLEGLSAPINLGLVLMETTLQNKSNL